MKVRVLTSLAIIVAIIPIILFSHTPVYPVTLSLLCCLCCYEMLRVFGREKHYIVSIPSYLVAAALPIMPYFIDKVVNQEVYLICTFCALFVYFMYLASVSVIARGQIKCTEIFTVFATVAYITVGFTAMSGIRVLKHGFFLFFIPFFCSWMCDIFAFLVGTFFGKHKLIPEVSPKKTVEGSVGGCACALLIMLLYGILLDRFVDAITVNYVSLCLVGVLVPALSQFGDLFASLIKREHAVKDYGTLLPGHGGIMDRFDSVISVSVITLIICVVFPPFV